MRRFSAGASAVLVSLREPGADRVLVCHLGQSVIHAVNLIEGFRKMLRNGVPRSEAELVLGQLQIPVISELFAVEMAELGHQSSSLSLSDCIRIVSPQKGSRTALTRSRRGVDCRRWK